MENKGTITESAGVGVLRTWENHVKMGDKKRYLADYFTMLVKQGVDIEPLMGKPLSHFDFNAIYKTLEDYNGKQQKLGLENKDAKPAEKGK